MALTNLVISLGVGGGVVMGPSGNTNFAFIPSVEEADVYDNWKVAYDPSFTPFEYKTAVVELLLSKYPYFLIDCGPETSSFLCGGSSRVIQDLNLTKNLQGIFITHTHADHIDGILTILYRTFWVERRRLPLYFAPSLKVEAKFEELDHLNGHQRQLFLKNGKLKVGEAASQLYYSRHCSFFDFVAWHSESNPERVGTFEYRWIGVSHNIGASYPAYSLVLSFFNSSPTGPGTIVFSGDTAYPLHYIKGWDVEEELDRTGYDGPWYKPGLIFHDVQFYSEDEATSVHCPFKSLERAVPASLRADVRLTHYGSMEPSKTEAIRNLGFRFAQRFSVYALRSNEVVHTDLGHQLSNC